VSKWPFLDLGHPYCGRGSISKSMYHKQQGINLASGDSIFTGITAWVWVVIVLQGFKAIQFQQH